MKTKFCSPTKTRQIYSVTTMTYGNLNSISIFSSKNGSGSKVIKLDRQKTKKSELVKKSLFGSDLNSGSHKVMPRGKSIQAHFKTLETACFEGYSLNSFSKISN